MQTVASFLNQFLLDPESSLVYTGRNTVFGFLASKEYIHQVDRSTTSHQCTESKLSSIRSVRFIIVYYEVPWNLR